MLKFVSQIMTTRYNGLQILTNEEFPLLMLSDCASWVGTLYSLRTAGLVKDREQAKTSCNYLNLTNNNYLLNKFSPQSNISMPSSENIKNTFPKVFRYFIFQYRKILSLSF